MFGGIKMQNYIRKIDDKIQASHFLNDVLGVLDGVSDREHLNDVVNIELCLSTMQKKSTLLHDNYRDPLYADEKKRKDLYEQIFKELTTLPLLENDDEIKLGNGGACPNSGLKFNKTAYYIIGLPASGKSGIATKLANHTHSLILDADFAKRKFPEYDSQNGAALTHEESSAVIFGNRAYQGKNLFEWAIKQGANIIIPKIGDKLEKVINFVELLRKCKYKVHLVLVRLDRLKSTQRAYYRFLDTNRYVPLTMIFDEYSNEPTIVYYDLKSFYNRLFKSFTMISTDVDKGCPPKICEMTKHSPLQDFNL